MKKLFSFLAFIIFFQPAWPFVEYFLFKDYIIAEFCINQDNPEMECDGTCFLHDHIALHSDHDHKNSNSNNQIKTGVYLVLYFENPPKFNLKKIGIDKPKKLSYSTNLYTQSVIFEIFQPPRAIA
ncbi:MAG TPA: hypothetical protein VK021_00865 [Flavobacteriaceae bacterium]|nr:hypothetical protein [Flavobacteriaceae bacterium]